MANKQVVSLIRAISGQANVLTIPRMYVDLTKSHRAALLLSQCVYWSTRGHRGDGWFYKSFREWRDELGLPRHATETAVRTLKKLGYLETEIGTASGPSPTTWYRVNIDKLAADLTNSNWAETDQLIRRKTTISSYSSETTTPPTSGNKTNGRAPSYGDGYLDISGDQE